MFEQCFKLIVTIPIYIANISNCSCVFNLEFEHVFQQFMEINVQIYK